MIYGPIPDVPVRVVRGPFQCSSTQGRCNQEHLGPAPRGPTASGNLNKKATTGWKSKGG